MESEDLHEVIRRQYEYIDNLTKMFRHLNGGLCLRERSTNQTKRKLADHKLEEQEGSTRDVGSRCTGCYAKRRVEQSRSASNASAKKLKIFCSDCDKYFCLQCFNDRYCALD